MTTTMIFADIITAGVVVANLMAIIIAWKIRKVYSGEIQQ